MPITLRALPTLGSAQAAQGAKRMTSNSGCSRLKGDLRGQLLDGEAESGISVDGGGKI